MTAAAMAATGRLPPTRLPSPTPTGVPPTARRQRKEKRVFRVVGLEVDYPTHLIY